MKNRVGRKVPTSREIEELRAKIDEIEAALAEATVLLSALERRRVPRFKRGGARIVEAIASLAEQHGVSIPGVSVADLRGDLELAERLTPLLGAVDVLRQRLADTILEARGEAWFAATSLYLVLQRVRGAEPRLHTALEPIEAFFVAKRNHRPRASDSARAG